MRTPFDKHIQCIWILPNVTLWVSGGCPRLVYLKVSSLHLHKATMYMACTEKVSKVSIMHCTSQQTAIRGVLE